VAVAPPGASPGYWAGAPSAWRDGDDVWLAYRLRRPVGGGRGYAVVVARSQDGVSFEPVWSVEREAVGADSLERPALVRDSDGIWRLYLSCATPGTLHWTIQVLDADHPTHFDPAGLRPALAADPATAYKDPVVVPARAGWEMWACRHLVEREEDADRMATVHATSSDGTTWHVDGVVLAPGGLAWDQRGTRLTAVVQTGLGTVAYYDGRASFEENWEERTGLAIAAERHGSGPQQFVPVEHPPLGSPQTGGALRYMSVVPERAGYRFYYEVAASGGAHDLRTEYVSRPRSPSQSW
jgi:hypothetical protein